MNQVVWATKASSKGPLSRKGLTLRDVTRLISEDGAIKMEVVRKAFIAFVFLSLEQEGRGEERRGRVVQATVERFQFHGLAC